LGYDHVWSHSGVNVMIFEIFSPKKLVINWQVRLKIKRFIHKMKSRHVFRENLPFSRRK
jgi:hypothetical protein